MYRYIIGSVIFIFNVNPPNKVRYLAPDSRRSLDPDLDPTKRFGSPDPDPPHCCWQHEKGRGGGALLAVDVLTVTLLRAVAQDCGQHDGINGRQLLYVL